MLVSSHDRVGLNNDRGCSDALARVVQIEHPICEACSGEVEHGIQAEMDKLKQEAAAYEAALERLTVEVQAETPSASDAALLAEQQRLEHADRSACLTAGLSRLINPASNSSATCTFLSRPPCRVAAWNLATAVDTVHSWPAWPLLFQKHRWPAGNGLVATTDPRGTLFVPTR